MYHIRKRFMFEGAHILSDARSLECKEHIHGHSYIVDVYLCSSMLNSHDMVMDFSVINECVKYLVDDLDHKCLANLSDPRENIRNIADILMPFNPTAERLAYWFYTYMDEALKRRGFNGLSKVRVHETATGYAEYWED